MHIYIFEISVAALTNFNERPACPLNCIKDAGVIVPGQKIVLIVGIF